jgi:inhibitor of Bruton tyrosine kinase
MCVPQVTTPKHEGPAWGGAKFSKGPASLRDIQNEQRKTKTVTTNVKRTKERVEEVVEPACGVRIPLSTFLHSDPVAVVPAHGVPITEAEKSTPPWSSVGSSPKSSRPSLRDIQMQQVLKKKNYEI